MSEEVHTAHVFKAGRGTFPERVIGGLVAGLFSMAYFFPFIHMLSIIPFIYLYPYSIWSWLNLVALVALFIIPGHPSKAITASYPFRCMMNYFDFELICEPTAEELASKNYIYATTPHGVLSIGGLSWGVFASVMQQKIASTAVASVVLATPYVRQILSVFPMVSASRRSLVRTLKHNSVVLYVGGIAELLYSSAKEEKLHIRDRKGFIKLAMQTGCDVIPVYSFGNTTALHILKSPFLTRLSRKIGASITIMYGRWGLPIPKPVKAMLVIGMPLGIPKIEHPTEEQIDMYHAKYVEAVRELFDKYKEKHPQYAHKDLIMH